jgi:hypothetical protein
LRIFWIKTAVNFTQSPTEMRFCVASRKKSSAAGSGNDLWLAPKSNFKSEPRYGIWRDRNVAPSSRLLELADIALGFRKPTQYRKRRSSIL